MPTCPSRPRHIWCLLVAACLTLFVTAVAAAQPLAADAHARSFHHTARAAHVVPHYLSVAGKRSTRADRILVAKARTLKQCLSKHSTHPRKCKAARRGVQHAGSRLAAAERQLAMAADLTGKTASPGSATSASALQAPQLAVSGQTLTWNTVANVNTYVLERTMPGQADQYSMVSGTSTTPPPVPGVTVHYSVRTAIDGSTWASEQSIAYPLAAETPDAQAAPAISVLVLCTSGFLSCPQRPVTGRLGSTVIQKPTKR